MRLAAGVVTLDRERAACADQPLGMCRRAFGIFLLGVIHDHLVVHLRDDVLAFHADRHGEPLVVLSRGFEVVLDVVEAGGALGVAMRVVDLHFVAFRGPAGALDRRVKIHAGVRLGLSEDVQLQLEVLE